MLQTVFVDAGTASRTRGPVFVTHAFSARAVLAGTRRVAALRADASGDQGASLLMLMAKSRLRKPENVKRFFKRSPESIAKVTGLMASGEA
ncbi:hypothetical protein SAMN05216251_13711 [Actinacidiphila alni]|uniref:Uncharacterized protein n=1 Tax=Actinacidiphila alni TaxID=380248 RepID=A0A1I2MJ24_9ACTN|nr:hypothetical protein [Actinacidiphila alni]SFF91452.1 hypothetical protein SAMN05216251_13711 [Actinacidiphila alni]